MTNANRVSAADARDRVRANLALLVCIYDDEKFYGQAHLEGALPMSEFLRMKSDLPLSTNIIFY